MIVPQSDQFNKNTRTMSVLALSQEEIEEVAGGLIYALKNRHIGDNAVMRIVSHSPSFLKIWDYENRTSTNASRDKAMQDCIARMVWYMWIGNKVAFALQYREEPAFFSYTEREHRPRYVRISRLISLMHLFRYNVRTNDGNCFVGEQWLRLFEDIMHALTESAFQSSRRQSEPIP